MASDFLFLAKALSKDAAYDRKAIVTPGLRIT
jgi:hypothetical protein